MAGKVRNTPLGKALQAAGFICLPDLWVRPFDMPKIKSIAGQYADEVNEIRAQVRRKEEAWDSFDKERSSK